MNLSVKTATAMLLVFSTGLSGCSQLPSSGPDRSAFAQKAAVRIGDKDRSTGIDYVLLDVSKNMLSYFPQTTPTSFVGSFGVGRGGGRGTVLGPGDIVQVSIFEAASGGLFIPADAGSRPGNYITLPSQTVDSAGRISVPYAGRIRVAGRPTEAVQQDIEKLLANRAIEPQVLISIVENRSNEVSVLGDVNAPARLDINPAGERILDVIARAGGLSQPNLESYVTLQRGGRESTVPFASLLANERENVFVAPGDTIYVNRERRTFLAFGASGLNGRIDFQETNLTVGEALAQAGGLLDNRADPAQVFLYRMVDRSTLVSMRIDVSRFHGASVPVIIRANLRDPSSLFALQQLPMADKDILYVANAGAAELQKFLSLISTVTGTASGTFIDVNSGGSAVGKIIN